MTTPAYDQLRIAPTDPDDERSFAFNGFGVNLLSLTPSAAQELAVTPVYQGRAAVEWTGTGAETIALQAEYQGLVTTDPVALLRAYADAGTAVGLSMPEYSGQSWLVSGITGPMTIFRIASPVKRQWTITLTRVS